MVPVNATFHEKGKTRAMAIRNPNLENHVDSLITIPNDKLISVLGEEASLMDL